jgi:hypothetical protein
MLKIVYGVAGDYVIMYKIVIITLNNDLDIGHTIYILYLFMSET